MDLEKRIKDLEVLLETEKAEKAKLIEDNKKLGEDLTKKDELIRQKTQDIVGVRREAQKKLSEMSKEDLDKMTEKEKELQARQEAIEAQTAEFEAKQKEAQQKEISYRRSEAIRKIAGKDVELAKKIEANFGRIKDSEVAQTPDEIERIASEAFNMTGASRPQSAMQTVMNNVGSGDAAPGGEGKTFADTPEGQSLAQALNLPTSKK